MVAVNITSVIGPGGPSMSGPWTPNAQLMARFVASPIAVTKVIPAGMSRNGIISRLVTQNITSARADGCRMTSGGNMKLKKSLTDLSSAFIFLK